MQTSTQPVRTRTFVYTHDEKRDVTGWKPVGTDDNFYPGPGHLVAHDTIEHFGNAEGWERELLAFGATMYGRMHTDLEMTQINAQDFVGFLTQDQNYKVPRTKEQYYNVCLPKHDEEFLGIYVQFIMHEVQQRTDPLYCFLNDSRPVDERRMGEVKEAVNNAVGWFRRGWLIAHRLHHGHSFKDLIQLVNKVTREVNTLTQRTHPQIGDKITVSVNRAANTFSITTA